MGKRSSRFGDRVAQHHGRIEHGNLGLFLRSELTVQIDLMLIRCIGSHVFLCIGCEDHAESAPSGTFPLFRIGTDFEGATEAIRGT